jgi:hypothetical protein
MISKQIVVQSEIAMSLEISQVFVDAILTQSRAEYPDEACGVILGPLGSDRALRIKPMINAAHSPTFYELSTAKLMIRTKRLSLSTTLTRTRRRIPPEPILHMQVNPVPTTCSCLHARKLLPRASFGPFGLSAAWLPRKPCRSLNRT